jgi:peptidylprolyl isomerase
MGTMKSIKATAILAVALAALAGCTGPGPQPSPTADPDEAAVSGIKWTGGGTEGPELDFVTPLRVSQATVGVIEAGDGPGIAMGQLVTFDSQVVDGETGTVEASTFAGDDPEQLILSPTTADITMLTAMQSAKVGAKFLYVVPDFAGAASGSATSPAAETTGALPSKVIAISIRSVSEVPVEASGAATTPDAALPVVTFDAAAAPILKPPGGDPGGELVAAELIEGTGAKVADGQTLAVKYCGWLWDGTAVSAVWGDDPAVVVSLNDVISGWRKAIVGRPVGSRILMVIPPAHGFGGAGQDGIPPDSTLIFVVDVLAAY